MHRILSRLLVRVALVAASLAWGGFVFTQTVGDPGRGERIAAAVLADDDARAEVVAPITSAVMRSTGLPADQQPLVQSQVDQLLQDPAGARSFIDPFAGSWARMLGADDARPARFDLVPLLSQLPATAGLVGQVTDAAGGVIDDPSLVVPPSIPVGDVPLAPTATSGVGGVRSTVAALVLPLALVAAGLFAAGILLGERRWAMRRLGVWGIAAGGTWVIVPPLLVWAAGRWASGADSVVAVALDEALSGLLGAALVLLLGGVAVLASSFLVGGDRAPRTTARAPVPATSGPPPAPRRAAVDQRPVAPAPTAAPPAAARRRTRSPAAPQRPPTSPPAAPAPPRQPIEPTRTMPVAAVDDTPDDPDAVWDFYASEPRPDS
jgi:hypothetical protein